MTARSFLISALAALACIGAAAPQPANRPQPGIVRVRITTSVGAIVVALDARHAPRTTANFLAYADDGRLDGTVFFRAARSKGRKGAGFIEGGIGSDPRRALDPIPLEPTSRTGLHHGDGAISMAHDDNAPNTATGDFSLLASASPDMDARPGKPGYAAFGRVIAGMDVVKRILASPTGGGGSGAMKGEMLLPPVKIISVRRLDGQPHPTGRPKPWLLFTR
jgi:peptidyl-prolyl cis-trans isomerase A (cyclophilin A)